MPALLSLAVRALLILPVTVQDMTIIKDKPCFALCQAHVQTCPRQSQGAAFPPVSCPALGLCWRPPSNSYQRRHEDHKIFVNYNFRIAHQSLPVPQSPQVLWLCFFLLYVNVQGLEGIQKRAWGECEVPSWVPGLGV